MCIHTIKGKKYRYQHYRIGSKVYSVYLGPVGDSYVSRGFKPSTISKKQSKKILKTKMAERRLTLDKTIISNILNKGIIKPRIAEKKKAEKSIGSYNLKINFRPESRRVTKIVARKGSNKFVNFDILKLPEKNRESLIKNMGKMLS